jgi:hypothetical protein
MPQAIVNPEELERFAQQFNEQLRQNISQLNGQFKIRQVRTAEAWQMNI